MRDVQPLRVACFGEALWDVLPRGIFLGGAPLNVAYHLSRHGIDARPISAVGQDFLGDELLRRVRGWGIDARGIVRLRGRATGTVRATIDAGGNARYRIARDVAWDRIPERPAGGRRPAPAAIVFGTLALRAAANRRALAALVAAWPQALRVVDLNLRPPFDRPSVVAFALRQAHVVKLNADELTHLTQAHLGEDARLEAAARLCSDRHRISRLCVTAGTRGAGLLWHGTWWWEPARPIVVRDTIGAGDAFLAGLLAALLRGVSPANALRRACRLGEFVAAADGATPPYAIDQQGRAVAE